jgi:hypothetical protein
MLKEQGFSYGPEPRTTDDLVFTRPSHKAELFESIIVGGQGKRGEAVSAEVGVAVTNWVMYKLLGDVQFLSELGEDPQRGWTIIEDDDKARQWETRLVEVGPVRAKEWAASRGPQLLQETAHARAAVSKYLCLLEPTTNLHQKLALLKSASNKRILEETERLTACPIFGDGPNTELAYRVACQLIVSHSENVEGKSYLGHEPMNDPELLSRIEILADRLLHADSV